jgi:anaerobic selenocysteine-containing dehydrogenase
MVSKLTRRQFFKVCATGMAGSSLAALGFAPTAALAEVREFKLLRTTETRNTCTYCSVACGIIMYSKGNLAKGEKAEIVHIEGDSPPVADIYDVESIIIVACFQRDRFAITQIIEQLQRSDCI